MRFLPLLCPVMLAIVAGSCSSNSTVSGGGSDLPNGKVAVTVTSGGKLIAGSTVIMYSVFDNDSIIPLDTIVSSSKGTAVFDAAPAGSLAFQTLDNAGNMSAMTITKVVSGKSVSIALTLLKPVKLYGYVVGLNDTNKYTNIAVGIAGTNLSTHLDTAGYWSLSGVPSGRQDIVFGWNKNRVHLLVSIDGSSGDSMLVKDLVLEHSSTVRTKPYSYYNISPDSIASFVVTPREYVSGIEPDYYTGANTAGITYYKWLGDTVGTYTPDPYLVELVTGATMWTDDNVSAYYYLESLGATVFPSYDSVSSPDKQFFSLAIFTYDARFSYIPFAWDTSSMRMISCNYEMDFALNMVEGQYVYTLKNITRQFHVVDSASILCDSLRGADALVTDNWGKPQDNTILMGSFAPAGANVIAVSNDQNSVTYAYLWVFEKGALLSDTLTPSPGRRAALFFGTGVFSRLSGSGFKLFSNLIAWMRE